MKIIFLDFDGVITNANSNFKLREDKLNSLGQIIEATDCSLVISSSWRKNTIEDTVKYLSDNTEYYMNGIKFPFCERIIGVTERLYCKDENDNWQHKKRGFEIKKWIDDNSFIGRYVILDDDADFLKEQLKFWIYTDPLEGMTETDVKNAIEILNRSENTI